jgi:DNA-directed RNA polymerase subunit RPC12/RpoP
MINEEYLECQQCGSRIRLLTEEEIRKIAINPYSYIVKCNTCEREDRDED